MIQQLVRPGPPAMLTTYRSWDIELQWHPAEVGETWGIPACFVGKLMAVKMLPGQGRPKFTVQPLWMTRGQMEKIKSDLDQQSATQYMIDTGLQAIKRSIDLYESGAMTPEQMPETLADLDPARDLNNPRLRINVGPDSAPPEKPG